MKEKKKNYYDVTRVMIHAISACVLVSIIGVYTKAFGIETARGLLVAAVLLLIVVVVIRMLRGDYRKKDDSAEVQESERGTEKRSDAQDKDSSC
jgi:membrane protein YdbS with pleckstrin-like domain